MTNKQTDQTNNKKTPKTTPKNKQKNTLQQTSVNEINSQLGVCRKITIFLLFYKSQLCIRFLWMCTSCSNSFMPMDIKKYYKPGERNQHLHLPCPWAPKKKNGTTHGTVQWHLVYHYSTSAMKRAFEKLIQLCYYCCQTILLKESVLYINS